MKRIPLYLLTFAALVRLAPAQTNCSPAPVPDPAKNFFSNFMNPCYFAKLPTAKGDGPISQDLNQTYARAFFRPNLRYELVFIGEYPKARHMNVTVYDDHNFTSGWITDANIVPLTTSYINPFRTGNLFKEDQLYIVTTKMGGTEPPPANIAPGCSLSGVDIHANVLDGTRRHPGVTWNGVANLPIPLPPHDDAGPSLGGSVTFREYLNEPDQGSLALSFPIVVVRDLTNGCAVPIQQALVSSSGSFTNTDQILTWSGNVCNCLNVPQLEAHERYRNATPKQCYSYAVPGNQVVWMRPNEYQTVANPDTPYIVTQLNLSLISNAITNGQFIRMRFRLPTVANLPCAGCSLNGTEQLRYWSLSFLKQGIRSLASLSDKDMVRDPNGYVTLIVGLGAQPPAWVTAANYYTYFDFSKASGYNRFARLMIRDALAGAGYLCSGTSVPFTSTAMNSLGGFMGEYLPWLDFVTGTSLPQVAAPLVRPNACGVTPPEPPVNCPF